MVFVPYSRSYSSRIFSAGQLPELAGEGEGQVELQRDGHSEQEAPALDPDDHVGPHLLGVLRHLLDDLAQCGGAFEDGGDVLEEDAGLGKVRNVAHERLGKKVGHRLKRIPKAPSSFFRGDNLSNAAQEQHKKTRRGDLAVSYRA